MIYYTNHIRLPNSVSDFKEASPVKFLKELEKRRSMEKRIFSDPSIPAFFSAKSKPFKIIPQRNEKTGQVEFLVEGSGIDEALDQLYANESIGALDFIKALKALRSSIFALKSGAGER